jgi:hypothetical protein
LLGVLGSAMRSSYSMAVHFDMSKSSRKLSELSMVVVYFSTSFKILSVVVLEMLKMLMWAEEELLLYYNRIIYTAPWLLEVSFFVSLLYLYKEKIVSFLLS